MMRATQVLRDGVATGAVAAVTTAATAALWGKLESGSALGALNAVSHILWGDEAGREERASLKYTAAGAVLHGAAVGMWGVVHAGLERSSVGQRMGGAGVLGSLVRGAVVAGVAYVVDYYVVPKRLTPGFELRMSGRGLAAVYGVLGLTLGLAGARRRR